MIDRLFKKIFSHPIVTTLILLLAFFMSEILSYTGFIYIYSYFVADSHMLYVYSEFSSKLITLLGVLIIYFVGPFKEVRGVGLKLSTIGLILGITWFFILTGFQAFLFTDGSMGIDPNHPTFFLKAISAVFIAPFLEEIFFRKILGELLIKKFSFFICIILTSMLFALLHWPNPDIICTFVFGLFLSFMYMSLRSIYFTIIVHMSFNTLVILAWHIPGLVIFIKSHYMSSIILSIFMIILLSHLVLRKTKNDLFVLEEPSRN